jgi:formylglycine-generating enzyme required for sulfatase activity
MDMTQHSLAATPSNPKRPTSPSPRGRPLLSRQRAWLLVVALALGFNALLAAAQSSPSPNDGAPGSEVPAATDATDALGRPAVLELSLQIYGDTPSLAWSPDGRRLAFASASYEHAGSRREAEPEVGAVHVFDRQTRAVTQVADRAGYRPRWVDDHHLSVLCTGDDWDHLNDCLQGDGEILPVGAADGTSPPSAPALEWVEYDACPDHIDPVEVWTDPSGLWLELSGRVIRLDPTPANVFCGPIWGRCEPIEACLNADASAVAYVARGGEVRVYGIANAERLLSGPSELVAFPTLIVRLGLTDAELSRHRAACRASGSRRCSESRFANERSTTEVAVAPFYLEQAEVSRAQYDACVSAGVCPSIDESTCEVYDGDAWVTGGVLAEPARAPDAARTCVTRDEAAAYCAWLGRRLPSDAEWQAAAGGAERRIFAWGDAWDAARVRYLGSSPVGLGGVTSHPEGRTPEGLFHMSGNAYEWVAEAACDSSEEPADPSHCATRGSMGILRGGSFASDGGALRTTSRRLVRPNARIDTNGFRCVSGALPTEQWCDRAGRLTSSRPYLEGCWLDEAGAWSVSHDSWDIDADSWGSTFHLTRVDSAGFEASRREVAEESSHSGGGRSLRQLERSDVWGDARPELLFHFREAEDGPYQNLTSIFTFDVTNGRIELVDLPAGIVALAAAETPGGPLTLYSARVELYDDCAGDPSRAWQLAMLARPTLDGYAFDLDALRAQCGAVDGSALPDGPVETRMDALLDALACAQVAGEDPESRFRALVPDCPAEPEDGCTAGFLCRAAWQFFDHVALHPVAGLRSTDGP